MRDYTYPVGTKIFVAPVLHRWRSLENDAGISPTVKGAVAPGFCLFFLSREDFEKEYPGIEPLVFEVLVNQTFEASTTQRGTVDG